MANGNTLSQMREMADKEKLSTPQALPLLMAAVADMYESQVKEHDIREKDREDREALHKVIIGLAAKVETNKEDIEDLKKRSNLWDGINSVLLVIGTFLGVSTK